MGQKIELGKAHTIGTGIVSKPQTINERINLLEKSMKSLTQAFNAVNSAIVKDSRQQDIYDGLLNKDGIPVEASLLGQSIRGGIHVLSVKHNKYCIGAAEYDSLSAAAEAASGVRRSGWTFWRVPDGRTVKEVYGESV